MSDKPTEEQVKTSAVHYLRQWGGTIFRPNNSIDHRFNIYRILLPAYPSRYSRLRPASTALPTTAHDIPSRPPRIFLLQHQWLQSRCSWYKCRLERAIFPPCAAEKTGL
jgi:hypothetical protein